MLITWTAARIEELTRLWGEGQSCAEIAAILGGTTRNAVIGKVHRLRLERRDEEPRARRQQYKRKPPRNRKEAIRIVSNGTRNDMRVTKTVTREAIALRCVEVVPLNVSLMDRADNGCQYIPGDDLLYCGHPRMKGKPYCGPHFDLCTEAPRPPKHKAFIREAA